jgi:serine/threonine protein kinase
LSQSVVIKSSEVRVKDRYTIERAIAEGGFGRVSLAIDQSSGEKVAVKELINFDADGFARFVNEYRILYEQIDNEYVVDVIDADFDARPPYIVLEYCEEGSLRKWVQERKPWQVVVFALSYALQGLEGIHRLGGFHRDLKPENILIARDIDRGFIVKVADFGLARVPRTLSPPITNHPAGTPGYIAPEVWNGTAGFHAGADIYSLGVVALELLTGGRVASELEKVGIPTALRDLVREMLSADTSKRPSVKAVARSLATIITLPDLAHGSTPEPEQQPSAAASPPAPQVAKPAPAPATPVAAHAPAPKGSGLGTAAAIGFAGALALLLGKLASDDSTWDESVQRRRKRDGRFKKGGRLW